MLLILRWVGFSLKFFRFYYNYYLLPLFSCTALLNKQLLLAYSRLLPWINKINDYTKKKRHTDTYSDFVNVIVIRISLYYENINYTKWVFFPRLETRQKVNTLSDSMITSAIIIGLRLM